MDRALAAAAAAFLGLAVVLGAFGAHGLKNVLDAYSLGVYEKAVFYHFVHGVGVLLVAMLPGCGGISHKAARSIGALLLLGIVIFSGSLYLLALTGVTRFGMITPVGGTAFIAAWGMLAWQLSKRLTA